MKSKLGFILWAIIVNASALIFAWVIQPLETWRVVVAFLCVTVFVLNGLFHSYRNWYLQQTSKRK